MKLKCPACNVQMSHVNTHSHYKIPIELDQCKKCGGVWFDSSELFTSHFEAHKDLHEINSKLLSKGVTLKSDKLLCPRDKVQLKRYKDSSFPEELLLESCEVCNGFFFNRVHFANYQKLRVKKAVVKDISDDALKAKIQVLLEGQSDKAFNQTIEKVSKTLKKPVPPIAIASYALFGLPVFILFALTIVFKELLFSLSGSDVRLRKSKHKEKKLASMVDFILTPENTKK